MQSRKMGNKNLAVRFPRCTLVHHFLEVSAASTPGKVAVIHEGIRVDYAEINAKANQLANLLIGSGIGRGERVAILFENCTEYVVSYYAALKVGAVAAPINTAIKPDGLASLIADIEPSVVICSDRYGKVLEAAGLSHPSIRLLILKNPSCYKNNHDSTIISWEEAATAPGDPGNPNLALDEDALASIVFTSGSTGRPKGVMLSHRNIVSNALSIRDYLNLTPSDVQMVVLPFFYAMGKSLLNTHFASGATLAINNKFAFPATVLEDMVAESVTGFSGVPSTYAYLLHRSPIHKYRERLTALRYCSQAGGHMPRAIKEVLRTALPPHTQIYIMYGATEATARLSYLHPERFPDKMDSIGVAAPGVTLKVVGPEGNERPPGEAGELVAFGDNIMKGYWKDSVETAKVLVDGCYHTGDLAYRDAEGYFYIVGRKDNLLKIGGHRVNPLETEEVLMKCGELVEAAVLGLPDPLLGAHLVAVAVPRNAAVSKRDILAYCARMLPKHKAPREIVFARLLPKNSSGKIDHAKCLEICKMQSEQSSTDSSTS